MRYLIFILMLCGAYGADQKPLVINPTSGKTEQLQSGNNLSTPVGSMMKVLDTTDSTGTTVGAVTVAGGVGIGKYLYAGTAVVTPVGIFGELGTGTERQVIAGYNIVGSGACSIQAFRQGTGAQTLTLNKAGGNVDVGGDLSAPKVSTDVLQMVGAVQQFNSNGGTPVFYIVGSGIIQIPVTITSTSPIVGSAIFGDGSTVNANVAIGGGNINAGGSLTVGSATLIFTSVNLTDGAAAQVGTLTNAPTAGNPTKWVPINDNGIVRYVPAW